MTEPNYERNGVYSSGFNDGETGGEGPVIGGVMPIGSELRVTIDKVAERYGVDVTYDEGRATLRGKEEDVLAMVSDLNNVEAVLDGADHPVPTLENTEVLSEAGDALEELGQGSGYQVATDGGYETEEQTMEDVDHESDVDGDQRTFL